MTTDDSGHLGALEDDGPFSATEGGVTPSAEADEGEEGSDAQPARRKHSAFRETLLIFVVGVVCAILLQTFLIRAYSIPSPSMVPTLLKGDRVLVNKRAYPDGKIPPRGDIVVFARPNVARCPFGATAPDVLIKRVIGRPGETVQGKSGRIFVNGAMLEEPWFDSPPVSKDFDPVTVGADQILVLGDNRTKSQDGSCFGPVDVDTVVGHAFHRIWPVDRFGGI